MSRSANRGQTPSGQAPDADEDVPVFDRADTLPKVQARLAGYEASFDDLGLCHSPMFLMAAIGFAFVQPDLKRAISDALFSGQARGLVKRVAGISVPERCVGRGPLPRTFSGGVSRPWNEKFKRHPCQHGGKKTQRWQQDRRFVLRSIHSRIRCPDAIGFRPAGICGRSAQGCEATQATIRHGRDRAWAAYSTSYELPLPEAPL